MKSFGKVLKFELKNYLTNKVFVIITLVVVVAIAVMLFFPRILAVFDHDDAVEPEQRPVMLIVSDTPEHAEPLSEAFTAAFADYEVQLTDAAVADVHARITDGDVECAFVMDSLTSYTYCVNNLSMYDGNTMIADAVLQSLYRMSAMVESGLPAEQASAILSAPVEHETVSLGKDQMQNFFYTYIMTFALYMVILLYGQMVASNVASEKSSRAMELLITSVKPVSMMFGKIVASCLAGLIQLAAIFGSALLCFKANQAYWSDNAIVTSLFDIPIELLLYMLLFFMLGFFLYAFLYGAIGSTVSKLEDINTAVMPITMLFIVAFFVVVFSMSSGNVDNTVMRVCSYIPFTSPMAMFTRIAMSTVPTYEIVLSTAILLLSVGGAGVLSAKIYRVGVLLYGTTPKLSAILKAIKKA